MGVDHEHKHPKVGAGGFSRVPSCPEANGGNIVITSVDKIINWSRANSLWPLVFGTSCCAIEMMATGAARHDWSRFGTEVARATPKTGGSDCDCRYHCQ